MRIDIRQGQPRFRTKLLKAYGARCAVTTCDLEQDLEAGHLFPHLGKHTNQVQIGLLMRSDLHTNFDRGLIGVETVSWSLAIRGDLCGTHYEHLSSAAFRLPAPAAVQTSAEAPKG